MGDLNGIGIEVIIKCFNDPSLLGLCTPVIYGSDKAINYYNKQSGIGGLELNVIRIENDAVSKTLNVLNCWEEDTEICPGVSTGNGGKYALISLERSIGALRNGQIDVLITSPVNKFNIPYAGFTGHTGYLAEKFGANEVMMIMVSGSLKIAVVTGHIPLRDVSALINTSSVFKAIGALQKSLKVDFAMGSPRIAVLGLNPHAGDSGIIGREEIDEIIPAIGKANSTGINVSGPFSADGFFGSAEYKNFDAVLAMYHDQGLTPFKALSFHNGVNFTAGLPFVRTSPSHGVAYPLAGKNRASASSFKEAVVLACNIFKTRGFRPRRDKK